MSNETKRINKLRSYDILDSQPSEIFDTLTRLISHVFNVPTCLVSLVDLDRQWFKSTFGLEVKETPRCDSFCSVAIETPDQVLVVEDASTHPIFQSSNLVIGEPFIRFYAGAPLIDHEGFALGTICIIDYTPRHFSDREVDLLKYFSQIVMYHISQFSALESILVKEKFEKIILDNLHSYIFVKDDKNNVLYANKAAAEKIGVSASTLKNKSTKAYFPEYADKFYQDDLEVLKSGQPKRGIIEEYLNSNDHVTWIRTDKIPIEDPYKNIKNILVIADDITEEKRLTEELKKRTALKAAILDVAHFAIFSTDQHGIIKTFSKGASELFGYEKIDLVNKVSPAIFFRLEDLQVHVDSHIPYSELFPSFLAYIASERRYTKELTVTTKQGETRTVLMDVTALYEEQNLSGYVFVAKDISLEKKSVEHQKIFQSLEQTIDELTHAIKVKSEFFATMSHEIRTPLTSIISLATILLDEHQDEMLCNDIKELLNSAEYLKKILSAILDYAKIESGNMGIVYDTYDKHYFVREVKRIVDIYTSKDAADIRLHISKHLPDSICLDIKKVTYVLDNLISNSIKFSDSQIAVEINVYLEDSNLVLSVKDNGVGIKEEDATRIFQPYIQLDGSLSRQAGGLGLGLPLSKALLELMGGKLSFSANYGKGTTFKAQVPLLASAEQSVGKINENVDVAGRKILFADDTLTNRAAITKILKQMGFDVTEAANGVEVLHHVKTSRFDVLLLDIHMPLMSGIEVLEKLQNENVLQHMPVIMLSACVIGEEIEYSKKLGAKGFIAKPIDKEELSLKIKSVLPGHTT